MKPRAFNQQQIKEIYARIKKYGTHLLIDLRSSRSDK
jgi:hypothetical protein